MEHVNKAGRWRQSDCATGGTGRKHLWLRTYRRAGAVKGAHRNLEAVALLAQEVRHWHLSIQLHKRESALRCGLATRLFLGKSKAEHKSSTHLDVVKSDAARVTGTLAHVHLLQKRKKQKQRQMLLRKSSSKVLEKRKQGGMAVRLAVKEIHSQACWRLRDQLKESLSAGMIKGRTLRPRVRPGESPSTIKPEKALPAGALGSVLAKTKYQLAWPPLVIHIFWPLIMYCEAWMR